MALLMVQASNPSPPPSARITNLEESPKTFEGIQKSLEELHTKVDGIVLISKLDQVLAELKRLDARIGELKSDRAQHTTQRVVSDASFASRRDQLNLKLDDLHSTDAYTRLTRIERMLETLVTKQDETNEQARSIRRHSSFRLQSPWNKTPISTLAACEVNPPTSFPPVGPFRLNAQPSWRQRKDSAASPTPVRDPDIMRPLSSQDVFGRKQDIPQNGGSPSVKRPYRRDNIFKRATTLASQPVGPPAKKSRKSSTDSIIRTRAQKQRQGQIGNVSPLELTPAPEPPKIASQGRTTQDKVAKCKGSNEPIVIDDSSSEERGQAQTQDDTQSDARDRIGSPDDINLLSKQMVAPDQASETPSPELTLESLLAETQAVGATDLGNTRTQSSLIEGQPQEPRSSRAESDLPEEVFLPGANDSSLNSHSPDFRLRSKTSGGSDGRGQRRDKRTLNLGSDTEE
ncbi:hypothetical protein BCR39DRAFT_536217 [Naematelia encephala]|uniref:Uncharacterized protein n=1 Tax=Naematelia encephala TaxID=71784 RepID=A0A1Y2B0C4_9TREE|nr:hypothetical protein BCR39DRAFT_536217 [Naematelia encephala]